MDRKKANSPMVEVVRMMLCDMGVYEAYRLVRFLQSLATPGKKPGEPGSGLCLNLYGYLSSRRVHINDPAFVRAAAESWPEYSGDTQFPVPHPSLSARYAYIRTRDMWAGEYGDTRRRFCAHVADELRAALDFIEEPSSYAD